MLDNIPLLFFFKSLKVILFISITRENDKTYTECTIVKEKQKCKYLCGILDSETVFLGLFCTYFIVQGCTCAHMSKISWYHKKEMHSTHNGLEEEDCEEANVNNRAGLNKIPKCLCVSC